MNDYEAMLKENEFEKSPTQGWYVARRVLTKGRDLRVTPLPVSLRTSDGTEIALKSEANVAPELLTMHRGVLTVPGLINQSVEVDLEVAEMSPDLVEVGLRPSKRPPRWPLSEKRYFEAAWSVIDAFADELSEDRAA